MRISVTRLRWAHLPESEAPPSGWLVIPFTSIASVNAGQSPPSESYNNRKEGLPFLQGNGDFSTKSPIPTVWCNSPRKTARKGDTLISVRAPVGEVNRADRDYVIGRGLAAIRATGCDSDFLYHALQRWRFCLKRVAQGTTFDAVTARHFAQLEIALPSEQTEQAAIARILDAVDMAIERNRVALRCAQDLRASILMDLLGRGVGQNNKVRNPTRRQGDFTLSTLGRLPSVWRISSVGHEFDLQNGFTLNAGRRPRFKKRRYLRVANVKRDSLDLTDVRELEANDNEFMPRVLASDDLLVVEGHADRMEIGRCVRVTDRAAGMTFQNHLFRLRTKGEITAGFGCLWLNSAYAQRFWNARCATSSGLHTINQRALKQLVVPVPSKSEQQTIVTIVEQQRQHLDTLLAKRVKLQELKMSLMHDLLTGQVRVGDGAKAGAP